MSNRATIQPTKFVDLPNGEESYGVRVYDNYGQAYDNTWDSIPKDDIEILRVVNESQNEIIEGILDFIREEHNGIYIGDTWYDWDKIKDIIEGG